LGGGYLERNMYSVKRAPSTRTIMGTHNMPNHNIPVEVEMIFVLADRYRNTLGGNQDVCV
jgi:hypothetical protein